MWEGTYVDERGFDHNVSELQHVQMSGRKRRD
jgi:hypothetical protein